MLLLVVTAACGRFDFDARGDGRGGDGGGDADSDAVPQCTTFGGWASPTHLGNGIPSAFNDWAPALSDDGLVLVFDSPRDGTEDLFVSTRASVSDAFGAPIPIANVDTMLEEYGAAWLGDDLYYFSFNVGTGLGGMMISTYRGGTTFDPGMFLTPDFPGNSADLANGGLELFYTVNPSPMVYQVLHATRPTLAADWAKDTLVDGLTIAGDNSGWPSYDAARGDLYYEYGPQGQNTEVRVTHRSSVDGTFGPASAITTIGPMNGDPEISNDGTTLIFASDRGGGAGLNDLYITTRSCQ